MESGILGFGIWNSTLGIWNSAQKSGIPQHLESVIQVQLRRNPESYLESRIHSVESRIEDSLVYIGRNEHNVRKLKQRRFLRRKSAGSGLFSFLDDGFAKIFSQIVLVRVKKPKNTNLYRQGILEEKGLTSG